MPKPLANNFRGEWAFLSCMAPAVVQFDGTAYPSVEHAYHAAKTEDEVERFEISRMRNPDDVKRYAHSMVPGGNWEERRVHVMLRLLRSKFFHNRHHGDKLLATGQQWLEEKNEYGDTFWGTHNGQGENTLGKLLMIVRGEITTYRDLLVLTPVQRLRYFWEMYCADPQSPIIEVIRCAHSMDHTHAQKLAFAPGATVSNQFGGNHKAPNSMFGSFGPVAYGPERPALYNLSTRSPVATWAHYVYNPEDFSYELRTAAN